MGCPGSTSSTSSAALSAVRRAPQQCNGDDVHGAPGRHRSGVPPAPRLRRSALLRSCSTGPSARACERHPGCRENRADYGSGAGPKSPWNLAKPSLRPRGLRHASSGSRRGRLEHGFRRVRCDDCQAERLVAFSYKRRGFCPSCGDRRMAEAEEDSGAALMTVQNRCVAACHREAEPSRAAGFRSSCCQEDARWQDIQGRNRLLCVARQGHIA